MISDEQREVCRRFGVEPDAVMPDQKVGIARNVRSGRQPINGLRHGPEGEASGWYFWAGGELEARDDFFVALHAEHLVEWCPQVLQYLALPAGWRFLIAPGHEDIWFDESLLDD